MEAARELSAVQRTPQVERYGRRASGPAEIVGTSVALRRVFHQADVVAPTDAAVLIQGETGTGKELVARRIHDLSARRGNAFVTVNCAALPSGLLESELFGHERGAFTGAIGQKRGRFELADGGTIFLDEIGEIPLELQPKLLRVLQEQEFERLGGTRTIHVDVRVVAATNRDLVRMVDEQRFRNDLYYRLDVFPIHLPPLRERIEDIPALVRCFVARFAERMGRHIDEIPDETLAALQRHPWRGNIRELANVIERAVISSPGPHLEMPLVGLFERSSGEVGAASIRYARPEEEGGASTLAERTRACIVEALENSNWLIAGPRGAAARLGMKRTTLVSAMKRLDIVRPVYSR
jgi:formate hydrogenlyase transcriptional activator